MAYLGALGNISIFGVKKIDLIRTIRDIKKSLKLATVRPLRKKFVRMLTRKIDVANL